MSSAVAPLRYGSFRILWIANVLSAVGTFIQSVAGSWLMLDLTGSNTWVGLMVASSTLPLLFLALAAGALADMFDRTRLMLVAQAIMGGSAAAMSVLTIAGLITPPLLLALGLLLGVGVALNLPTWQALLPELVPRGMIASAVALQSAAFNAARAVGPAVGGAILAAFGAGAGFGVNALTYIFVIVAVVMVGRTLRLPEREQTSFSTAVALGVRFARFTPMFRRLLALVALFAVFSAVIQAVLPNHTRSLGGGELEYGILLGAMGVGALVAAWFREKFLDRFPDRPARITITGFGISGIVVALAPSIAVGVAGMLVSGFFWVLTLTGLNATAQLISPSWIRGRAMSLYSLSFGGILPIGSILAGVVADASSTGTAMLILSSLAVLLGLSSPVFGVPSVRNVEPPEFSEDRPAPIHDHTVSGEEVVVLNVWQINRDDLAEFSRVMNEVRLVRLRTGAYRWQLMRTAADPLRIVEFFEIGSWEEHLAQHRRIDDTSAALLARARSFDRDGGPTTRHLIGIDPTNPGLFEELIRQHEDLHRQDGSIPDFDQD
ncbi:MAG: MFS transporter [Actinobacteria bacterium]|nr:MAG: MFS transporter [Actinomycetota bacterium]REK35067.1 MAG: MFS transporter [Actinomycetota bacterium]